MTPWRSFEISWRFAAHHAESLAAHRWSLQHSDHEEVTNHCAHWTPLARKHTSNGIANSPHGIVNFWSSSNSGRERLFDVLFFSYIEQGVAESHGARIAVVGSREGAHPRFFVFIQKHAVLNGQTAHTKGCRENRCVTKVTHLPTTNATSKLTQINMRSNNCWAVL